jgi:hypothetical protein
VNAVMNLRFLAVLHDLMLRSVAHRILMDSNVYIHFAIRACRYSLLR